MLRENQESVLDKWALTRCISVLDRYIGGYRVSIINMNNGFKEPIPWGIKTVIPIKYWYLAGMSRWENLCIPEILFGSILFQTIMLILGWFYLNESSCMIYKPKWYRKSKLPSNIHTIRVKKKLILIIDIQMVLKKTIPIQHWYITNNHLMV